MRPKKHETTGSGDLFRARLEQIINMKHELVLLAGKIETGCCSATRQSDSIHHIERALHPLPSTSSMYRASAAALRSSTINMVGAEPNVHVLGACACG